MSILKMDKQQLEQEVINVGRKLTLVLNEIDHLDYKIKKLKEKHDNLSSLQKSLNGLIENS